MEISSIAKLQLGPSDVLVVRLTFELTADWADRIKDRLVETLAAAGHANRVIVLGPSADLQVITPKDVENG